MRVRFGVAMAEKGGRAAIVGVEVLESHAKDGRTLPRFLVGHVVRPEGTIEGTGDAVEALVSAAKDVRPCVIVDIGTPQGMALRQTLRDKFPTTLHRPHAYPGTGERRDLFAAFLEAYSAGRIEFMPGLAFRKELDKALVFYMGGKKSKTSVELTSEEEALVIALGLALTWPKHGPIARSGTAPQ